MDWIPVTERLPDIDGKSVLIYAASADPDLPLIHIAYYDTINRKWYGIVEYWAKAITHWTPLPEPPK